MFVERGGRRKNIDRDCLRDAKTPTPGLVQAGRFREGVFAKAAAGRSFVVVSKSARWRDDDDDAFRLQLQQP